MASICKLCGKKKKAGQQTVHYTIHGTTYTVHKDCVSRLFPNKETSLKK